MKAQEQSSESKHLTQVLKQGALLIDDSAVLKVWRDEGLLGFRQSLIDTACGSMLKPLTLEQAAISQSYMLAAEIIGDFHQKMVSFAAIARKESDKPTAP